MIGRAALGRLDGRRPGRAAHPNKRRIDNRLRCREVGCPAGQTAPRRMTGGFTVKNGPVTEGWAWLAVSSCDRNGGLPNTLPLVGRCLAPTTRGGRCVRAGRRTPFVLAAAIEGAAGISLRRQPGSDTTQDFAKLLECLRFVGLRHAQQSGEFHEQAFAKNLHGVARVYS